MTCLHRCLSLLAVAALLTAAGCSQEDAERRAREAADKVMESIPDVHARAAEQDAAPEDVRLAQRALTAVHEYQGEIHGELDRVTINAIQAFQRTHGLRDDGILAGRTMALLRAALDASDDS